MLMNFHLILWHTFNIPGGFNFEGMSYIHFLPLSQLFFNTTLGVVGGGGVKSLGIFLFVYAALVARAAQVKPFCFVSFTLIEKCVTAN